MVFGLLPIYLVAALAGLAPISAIAANTPWR